MYIPKGNNSLVYKIEKQRSLPAKKRNESKKKKRKT